MVCADSIRRALADGVSGFVAGCAVGDDVELQKIRRCATMEDGVEVGTLGIPTAHQLAPAVTRLVGDVS